MNELVQTFGVTIADFLCGCCDADPFQRYETQKLLEHPIFTKCDLRVFHFKVWMDKRQRMLKNKEYTPLIFQGPEAITHAALNELTDDHFLLTEPIICA